MPNRLRHGAEVEIADTNDVSLAIKTDIQINGAWPATRRIHCAVGPSGGKPAPPKTSRIRSAETHARRACHVWRGPSKQNRRDRSRGASGFLRSHGEADQFIRP